jgi:hypothetical protein
MRVNDMPSSGCVEIWASLSAMSRFPATPTRRRCGRPGSVFAACRNHRVAFLKTATPESIIAKLDEGVRVIAGHREETAILGRAHQKRTMPV